ncbi:MAG: RNA 2',3'-cyclic phosphodiesterase [Armatimonadetes bacterium]|nr:RNA 2',3'-cyclic phosphodiesterase [Armatimonadota bacterium]
MTGKPGEMLRLFYALRLSPETQTAVGALIDRLRGVPARVSWVQPANLHFTLKFLGDVPERLLPALVEVGEETGRRSAPVRVELAGVGTFPHGRSPRVIWVGCGAGVNSLEGLAANLASVLGERALVLGDNKPFAAHCTIGRVRDSHGLGELNSALTREGHFTAGFLQAEEFHLVRSDLAGTGPTYTNLASFALQREQA